MYLTVKRTKALEFLYGHVTRCVYALWDVGGTYESSKDLPFSYYTEFEDNMLAAKTALVHMLPKNADIEEFDLLPNIDQNSDDNIAGTFRMVVRMEKV